MSSESPEFRKLDIADVVSTKPVLIRLVMSNPWVQLGVALATVVGMLLALLALPYFTKDVKSLSIYQVDKRPLITRDADAATGAGRDLQIVFKGKEVSAPWASTLEIVNTGTIPIAAIDVEEPVSIDLGQTVILSGEIAKTLPEGINVSVEVAQHRLTIRQKLLNQGDRIVINLIVDGKPDIQSVQCRISGITEPIFEDRSTDVVTSKEPYWNTPRIISSVVASGVSILAAVLIFKMLAAWWASLRVEWFIVHPSSAAIMKSVERTKVFRPSFPPRPDSELFKARDLLPHRLPFEWLDNPSELDELLSRSEIVEELKKLSISPASMRAAVLESVRNAIHANAAEAILQHKLLHRQLQRSISEKVEKLEISSKADFLNQLQALLDSPDTYKTKGAPTTNSAVLRSAFWRFVLVMVATSFLAFLAYSLWQAIL